jgi:hypothetical protein
MLWSILLIAFVVDPDVLKHGAQAVSESEPGLTGWDVVSIHHYYYLRLVFPLTPPPPDCR